MKKRPHLPPPGTPFMQMTEKQMQAAFDEIGMGIAFALLQHARHGKDQEQMLAAAILRLPDETERYASVDMEYGDGEGIQRMDEWIEEVHRTPGLLVEGETLRRAVFKVITMEEIEVDIKQRKPQ